MAVKCGVPNPEAPGMTCYLKPPHATHQDIAGGKWAHTQLREDEKVRRENPIRKPGKRASKRLLSATAQAAEARRKALEAERGRVSPGVPSEAVGKWMMDEWVTYAGGVFTEFLKQHPGPFTTAEDVWPLLDRPEEMRMMVQVVRALLRARHMEEVGAKRLKGVYRTKDGYEFAENKLVPIYQSLICTH